MRLSLLKRVLFFAGAAMLGYTGFTMLESHLVQHDEAIKFEAAFTGPTSSRTSTAAIPGHPIGKLTIPAAGISAIVLEGDDDGILKLAPGHIPGTALPGEPGNVGIAAHRDTFFRNLKNLRSGDVMQLVTLKNVYEYKINAIEVVDPERIDVLAPSGDPTLTLVTVTPSIGSDRLQSGSSCKVIWFVRAQPGERRKKRVAEFCPHAIMRPLWKIYE
jgi:sortase A